MAKQSVFGTSVMGPDESAVGTIGNIAEMFNPENQAKGQLAQAHANYYKQAGVHAEASAALANAEAQAAKDQNDAYNEDALVASGMNRLQAKMFNAARNHYTDATKGYNVALGGEDLRNGQGDPNVAATLATGIIPTIGSAVTEDQGVKIRNQNNESKIAQLVTQGKLHNQGLLDRGVVLPAGAAFLPGSAISGQPAPAVAPSAGPSDLFNGQLAPAGFMDSLGKLASAAPGLPAGLPAGAILNPITGQM